MNTYCTQTPSWLFFKHRFWDVWEDWQREEVFHQDWVSHITKICQELHQCLPSPFCFLGPASAPDYPTAPTLSQDTPYAGLLWFFPSFLSDQKWAVADQLTFLENLPWGRHHANPLPSLFWWTVLGLHRVILMSVILSMRKQIWDAVQITHSHTVCK